MSGCGKGCLIGCGVVAAIGLIIAGIAVYIMWPFIDMGANQIAKVTLYFEDLKDKGWDVDDTMSNQPSGMGFEAEAGVPMTWRARESSGDDWTEYTWMIVFGEGETDFETMDWQDFKNATFVPVTEAALEVHNELDLPLPDWYDISDYDSSSDSRHDRNRDEVDESDEDNTNEDTGDEDRHERRSKQIKKAA
ncbi:MAG TPA: hypothetical protein VGB30_00355 [bacterium]|jgi:hypothetical protein